ncbi:hypothetical protein [Porphyromonas asaccharolytica]|jgi:hypothetical protein|uniref:Uncharacterized protein n=1 Tax=Porphyromonas asaccharolytica (strain ATCC 25260 / DSM 20707 / BCRC 10618 / CCUG 7834 / JCM 6326 / LMG 13178 / VPI 4198 / B440) TaxID=879243 RepID=F4KMB5_PORAD|nr:hypothetical protein [Porphyromonas asaccharolytica]AEE12234.1 hypothetical protein Poras_0280 [Porphyromonas asaccharolytica DSM 20707]
MAQTIRPQGRKQLRLAILLTVSGIGLLVAGFTVPPLGVIDSSVLVAFGEVMTFAGALLGLDYKYKYHAEQ